MGVKCHKTPKGLVITINCGDALLSQGASPQVPSALTGLTAVFGMGTGVSPPLWPPEILLWAIGTGRIRATRTAVPRAFHSEHEQVSKPSAD